MGLIHGLLASLFPPAPLPLDEVEVGKVVTVRGQILPRDFIDSTLTGERCVYYQYTVEEYRRPVSGAIGLIEGTWRLIQRDEAITEFYLASGGSRVIVAPQDVKVERARHVPIAHLDLGGMLDRRAQELLLLPGDTIEVTAMAEAVHDLFDDGRDYRSSPSCLMLRAPPEKKTLITLLSRSLRPG